jgi:hypothetical protein
MTELPVPALEQSTYAVRVSFVDAETGDPMTPKALAWRLVRGDGSVVNGRAAVAFAPEDLASTVLVVLSGDDLAFSRPSLDNEQRILFVDGLFDWGTYPDLPLRDEFRFTIRDLKGINDYKGMA